MRGEGKMRQARVYRGVMYNTSAIERTLVSLVVRDKNDYAYRLLHHGGCCETLFQI